MKKIKDTIDKLGTTVELWHSDTLATPLEKPIWRVVFRARKKSNLT